MSSNGDVNVLKFIPTTDFQTLLHSLRTDNVTEGLSIISKNNILLTHKPVGTKSCECHGSCWCQYYATYFDPGPDDTVQALGDCFTNFSTLIPKHSLTLRATARKFKAVKILSAILPAIPSIAEATACLLDAVALGNLSRAKELLDGDVSVECMTPVRLHIMISGLPICCYPACMTCRKITRL